MRTLARRQVWKMDGKIWEGFMRCAKRATPRSGLAEPARNVLQCTCPFSFLVLYSVSEGLVPLISSKSRV